MNRFISVVFGLIALTSWPVLGSVSESEVESLLKRVHKIYQPVASEAGGKLFIQIRKESALAVASAFADGKDFWVKIDGGFFLSPRQTRDGLIFGICHELGHLFGGAPRSASPFDYDGPVAADGYSLMSSEGQSDYYAALVCFRKIVAGEDHVRVLKGRKIPEPVIQACDRAWQGNADSTRICYRTALAAFEFLNLVREFPISFYHPDKSEADRTNFYSYPSRQCRLDTALAGAVCGNASRLRLDPHNPLADVCLAGPGARPACWFRLDEYR